MGSRRFSLSLRLLLACAGPVVAVGGDPAFQTANDLTARAGDRSVLLHWSMPRGTDGGGVHVYRADGADGPFARITTEPLLNPAFADHAVENGSTYRYRVQAADRAVPSAATTTVTASPKAFADDTEFLDFLQYAAFQYFWRESNPANGLVRDRSQPQSVASIAATGFGLTAIGIGIDRGWISRPEGRERVEATLRTFWEKPQGNAPEGCIGYRGWFYHFLDLNTALRTWNCELSTIDTALLFAGVIYAKNYFDQPVAEEQPIRNLADQLFNRIDWAYPATGTNSLSMGWRPETGFIPSRWIGYNEATILYLLGMGAAGNPLPAEHWSTWTGGYQWSTHFGHAYVAFAPLFGHQYSHCWIDFRDIADDYMRESGITYFVNSRRATLAQRAYCIANPGRFAGYGAEVWGLTACDGPGFGRFFSYSARGAPPPENDDGTIAPTAVGGSLPFAPEHCLPALRHFYEHYRTKLWTGYGFRDAFNLTADWWGPDILGIDQGPILIMAENHRTGSVWRVFMRDPIIQRGLAAARFAPLAQPAARDRSARAVIPADTAPR